jgi:D-alanine-D-alanine ligase
MNFSPAELPVILLYNLDPIWLDTEKDEIFNLVQCLVKSLSVVGHPTIPICVDCEELGEIMKEFDPGQHIILNWCEEIPGVPHSSAHVARKLEELGFTFTGADSQALQLSYDKPAVKELLQLHDIPTPYWRVYKTSNSCNWDCFPAIVKPAHEHSSFGITHDAVVHNLHELKKQIARIVATFQQPVLVEDFIDGREFHVTLVGNGTLRMFPVAEMDFSAIREDRGRLCTYDSKFAPGSPDYRMIQLRLPAVLSDEEMKQLEEVAVAAYRALDCRDYARLDIRLREGLFHVLDVNPNADISPDASVALSADLAGFSFGMFGSLLVNLAAHRHPVFGRNTVNKNRQDIPVMAQVN